jgi:hypothetical protein
MENVEPSNEDSLHDKTAGKVLYTDIAFSVQNISLALQDQAMNYGHKKKKKKKNVYTHL